MEMNLQLKIKKNKVLMIRILKKEDFYLTGFENQKSYSQEQLLLKNF